MPAAKRSTKRSSSKSKTSAKSSRTTKTRTTGVDVANQSHYNKLIKKGMTPKQAAAFSRNSGGLKKSGAKSSKGVTKRVTSRSKKK